MMTPEEVRAVEEATRNWTCREWEMYVERRAEHYAKLKDELMMTRDDFASVYRSVAAWNDGRPRWKRRHRHGWDFERMGAHGRDGKTESLCALIGFQTKDQ